MSDGNLGLGVMIQMLSGNAESVKVYTESVGKVIAKVYLGDDDGLHFEFTDDSKMVMRDEGQSCCEQRYMVIDDDLAHFVGATFAGAEIKEAPNVSEEYGEHEVQFLEVRTSKGSFTAASHNEHNGYYGGFAITCSVG